VKKNVKNPGAIAEIMRPNSLRKQRHANARTAIDEIE